MYSFLKTDYHPLPVEDSEILEFEQENEIRLPELLKSFYRQANGVPMCSTRIETPAVSCTVDRFFPLFVGSMSADHIFAIYQMCRYIPASYFPIALSDTGDDFFLDTETGEIYLMEIDLSGKKLKVADSLSEFFSLLEHGQKAKIDTELL